MVGTITSRPFFLAASFRYCPAVDIKQAQHQQPAFDLYVQQVQPLIFTRDRHPAHGAGITYMEISVFYGRIMVGETGFEPATLCSQSRCATRLRYSPTAPFLESAFRLSKGIVSFLHEQPAKVPKNPVSKTSGFSHIYQNMDSICTKSI